RTWFVESTTPSTEAPSSTPATSSPRTAGCPICRASAPSSFAAPRISTSTPKNPVISRWSISVFLGIAASTIHGSKNRYEYSCRWLLRCQLQLYTIRIILHHLLCYLPDACGIYRSIGLTFVETYGHLIVISLIYNGFAVTFVS